MMYIRQELRRALLSKVGLITILSSTLLVFIGMFGPLKWITGGGISIMYTFLQGYNSGTASFLVITFPIVACIPFASSYRTDIQTGFHNYVQLRMKKRQYMSIRLAVNALVGGVAIAIGPFISFCFLILVKLLFNVPMLRAEERLEPVMFFNSIGVSSPILMILIIIVIMFCCGAIFATLGLGVSTIIQNKYISIFVPFIYLIISATVLAKIHPSLNAMALYDVDLMNGSIGQTFLYGTLLGLFGITIFLIGGTAKFEEKYKE
ncbi:hypothetical protein ACQKM9_03835 [Viridibacillus sp. NPDC093762]|uniref:hypothetical protein n=1 Tax=Viridibacillus sp. NPDC093762 TaxID=3390720 RepID=UPI003D00485F